MIRSHFTRILRMVNYQKKLWQSATQTMGRGATPTEMTSHQHHNAEMMWTVIVFYSLSVSLTSLPDIFALVRYNSQNDSYRWVFWSTLKFVVYHFSGCLWEVERLTLTILFDVTYRLKIFSEESVPLFGPPLPSPPVFTDHQEFRDFLLVKCKKLVKHIEYVH